MGLAALAVPLAARKGGRLHRRAGWLFSGALALSLVTALMIAAAWIAIPLVVKPDAARYVEALRQFGAFFGLLGLAGSHALVSGIGAIGRRSAAAPWLRGLERKLTWMLLIASPVVAWLGLTGGSVLLAAFGILFTVDTVSGLRRPRPPIGRTVIVAHVDSMLGAATVATTAFTVQIVSRIDAAQQFSLMVWMVPVALGFGATAWWKRRLARAGGRYTAPAQ
ncbi:MAG: hypothetical protein AAF721_19610 [Myxococcota bacterium]